MGKRKVTSGKPAAREFNAAIIIRIRHTKMEPKNIKKTS